MRIPKEVTNRFRIEQLAELRDYFQQREIDASRDVSKRIREQDFYGASSMVGEMDFCAGLVRGFERAMSEREKEGA